MSQSNKDTTSAREAGMQVQSGMVSGFKAMGLRFAFSLFLRAVSVLTLSRLLSKEDYGLFGVVAVIAGLGIYFSDFGMGAALVQQEDEPSDDEATTVFWCQQIFTGGIVAVIIGGMPWILRMYNAPASATILLTAMALALWLSSLRAVPVIYLERRMKFEPQARCEMLESAFQLVATIVLAVLGTGAWALAGGGIIGRVVGLGAIWYASPWRPRGRFDLAIARRLWANGLRFQMNAVLPALVAFPIPVILNNSFGVGGLGLVNWASNIASTPMMLSGMLNRVAFPSFSRLQAHPEELVRIAGVATQRLGMGLSFGFAPLVIVAPVLIPVVFDPKWVDATALFQWGLLDALVVIMTNLLAQLLPAAGYVNHALKIQIPLGALRVVALVGGIAVAGINGVGPSNYVASVVALLVTALMIRSKLPGSGALFGYVLKPIASIHVFVGAALACSWFITHDTAFLPFARVGVGLLVFAVCAAVYDALWPGHPIRSEIRSLLQLARVPRAAASAP